MPRRKNDVDRIKLEINYLKLIINYKQFMNNNIINNNIKKPTINSVLDYLDKNIKNKVLKEYFENEITLSNFDLFKKFFNKNKKLFKI